MTTPIHEQQWKKRNTNIGPVIDDMSGHPEGEAVCMVYAPYPAGAHMTLAQSDAIRDARADAIEALPDMARALLGAFSAMMKAQDVTDGVVAVPGLADAVEAAENALRKAKVLP